MLPITVPAREMWNEEAQMFFTIPETPLQLEHSLLSISKWEAKWKKPFLETKQLTPAEWRDYVRCMTLSPKNPDPTVYICLTAKNLADVKAYVNDPMTATTIKEQNNRGGRGQFVTSELIYYWMVAAQIPFECERWHLNRLMVLIRICGEKSKPPKKMSKRENARSRSALNAQRRAAMHSNG